MEGQTDRQTDRTQPQSPFKYIDRETTEAYLMCILLVKKDERMLMDFTDSQLN